MSGHFSVLFHRLFTTKKELEEIYLNEVINTFGIAMISVFVPIYLLDIGFSLNDALFYIFVMFLAQGAASPFAAFLISKVGLKHTISLASPILILFFLLLNSIEFGVPFYFVAAVFGIGQGLYWIAFNTDFADNFDEKEAGKETALINALPSFFIAFAPLLGAFILLLFSFEILFVIASLVILVSIFPLFQTPDRKDTINYSWREIFSVKNKFYLFNFSIRGWADIILYILWPLFIFLLIGETMIVGISRSIGLLGIALITISIGKLCDRLDKKNLIRRGGVLIASILVLMAYASNEFDIVVLSFLGGVVIMLISVPLFASACSAARGENTLEFMVFRDVVLCSAKALLVAAIILFGVSLPMMFVVTSLVFLFLLFF